MQSGTRYYYHGTSDASQYCDMSTHYWVTQQRLCNPLLNTSRPNTLRNNRGSGVFSVPCRAKPHCTTLVSKATTCKQTSVAQTHTTLGGMLVVRCPTTASETTQ
jgi:hypothetical protein